MDEISSWIPLSNAANRMKIISLVGSCGPFFSTSERQSIQFGFLWSEITFFLFSFAHFFMPETRYKILVFAIKYANSFLIEILLLNSYQIIRGKTRREMLQVCKSTRYTNSLKCRTVFFAHFSFGNCLILIHWKRQTLLWKVQNCEPLNSSWCNGFLISLIRIVYL